MDELNAQRMINDQQLTELVTTQKVSLQETIAIQQKHEEMNNKMETMTKKQEHLTQAVTVQNQKLEKSALQTEQQRQVFNEINERLDSQEAWLEKLFRQIQDLRGIIYERADELIKKMEKNLQLFSGKWNVMQRNDTKSTKETIKK